MAQCYWAIKGTHSAAAKAQRLCRNLPCLPSNIFVTLPLLGSSIANGCAPRTEFLAPGDHICFVFIETDCLGWPSIFLVDRLAPGEYVAEAHPASAVTFPCGVDKASTSQNPAHLSNTEANITLRLTRPRAD